MAVDIIMTEPWRVLNTARNPARPPHKSLFGKHVFVMPGSEGEGQRFSGEARYTRPPGPGGKAEARRRRARAPPLFTFFPEARGARAGTLPRKSFKECAPQKSEPQTPREPVDLGAAAHMEYGGHSKTQPRVGGLGELENTLSRHVGG